jgi:hypothetical protein
MVGVTSVDCPEEISTDYAIIGTAVFYDDFAATGSPGVFLSTPFSHQ